MVKNVLRHIDYETITYTTLQNVVTCMMSLSYYFYNKIGMGRLIRSALAFAKICTSRFELYRHRYFKRCLHIVDRIAKACMPEMAQVVLNSVLTYFDENRLWRNETFCAKLYRRFIIDKKTSEKCIGSLLTLSEQKLVKDPKGSQMIIRTLYSVLAQCPSARFHISSLYRLLEMYRKSLTQKGKPNAMYIPVRPGLEVCIRYVMESLTSMDLLIVIRTMITWTFEQDLQNENILNLGCLLEYATMRHKAVLFKNTLTLDIFPLIGELITSKNRLHSLLGIRILQHVLDRQGNGQYLTTPEIFLEDARIHIKIPAYNSHDRTWEKHYRESIQDILLKALSIHGHHRLNLENMYTVIALFVIEIPCGFTVASMVCLLMNLQAHTLGDDNLPLAAAHRFHATILSLLSLICWVHKAKVLYDYIDSIVEIRAKIAPHLNPPLRATYNYALHHVLWNKKELFLEDWEIRYGLWKCFRSRRIKAVFLD